MQGQAQAGGVCKAQQQTVPLERHEGERAEGQAGKKGVHAASMWATLLDWDEWCSAGPGYATPGWA